MSEPVEPIAKDKIPVPPVRGGKTEGNTEPKPAATKEKKTYEQQILDSIDTSKSYKFVLCRAVKTHGHHMIGNVSTIIDPSKGNARVDIRYIPGLHTLYVNDQPKYEKDERPDVSMEFNKLQMVVPGNDKMKVAFLMMHDENADNPNRISNKPALFKLHDTGAIIMDKGKILDMKDEARDIVKAATDEQIKTIAYLVGKKNLPVNQLRIEIRELADRDPKYVLDNIGNPLNTHKYVVKKAFDANLLRVDPVSCQLLWTDSGQNIMHVPSDKDSITFIADQLMKEDNRGFRDSLRTRVDNIQ